MTNREWLNSLSDDDLIAFLMDSIPMKMGDFEYHWGLRSILFSGTKSEEALKMWLSREHITEIPREEK